MAHFFYCLCFRVERETTAKIDPDLADIANDHPLMANNDSLKKITTLLEAKTGRLLLLLFVFTVCRCS
jgi:hypothetical protein